MFLTVQLQLTTSAVTAEQVQLCVKVVSESPVPNANSGVPW